MNSLLAQDLFVFAGQSNMQGYGLNSDLTVEDLDNTGIYEWDWHSNAWVHNPNPRTDHDVFHAERRHGLIIHDLRDNFGPELSTLKIIRDKTGQDVYFIKYAVGGSSLNERVQTYTPRLQA